MQNELLHIKIESTCEESNSGGSTILDCLIIFQHSSVGVIRFKFRWSFHI